MATRPRHDIEHENNALLSGGVTEPERHSVSYAEDKQKILTRLRRIEGQVRGIARMV